MTVEATGKALAFAPESEGALCLVSSEGLDIFVFKAGVEDWAQNPALRGVLDYGLFVAGATPFFLLRIKGLIELAVGVNFQAQPADRLHAFLNRRGLGICSLVLCGFPEPRIVMERRFSVREDVMREMRELGSVQIAAYADAGECAAAMAVAMRRMDAARMIRSTVMYQEETAK